MILITSTTISIMMQIKDQFCWASTGQQSTGIRTYDPAVFIRAEQIHAEQTAELGESGEGEGGEG